VIKGNVDQRPQPPELLRHHAAITPPAAQARPAHSPSGHLGLHTLGEGRSQRPCPPGEGGCVQKVLNLNQTLTRTVMLATSEGLVGCFALMCPFQTLKRRCYYRLGL
jgi:hypothetical protein